MSSPLERLAGPGQPLAIEPPDATEFESLKRSGLTRLRDAENAANSLDGRFDLAYAAAHALCLAALRIGDSAPRSATSSSKFFRIRSVSVRRSGACFRSATTCGIGPSTRARPRPMNGW